MRRQRRRRRHAPADAHQIFGLLCAPFSVVVVVVGSISSSCQQMRAFVEKRKHFFFGTSRWRIKFSRTIALRRRRHQRDESLFFRFCFKRAIQNKYKKLAVVVVVAGAAQMSLNKNAYYNAHAHGQYLHVCVCEIVKCENEQRTRRHTDASRLHRT